jgi:diguanylate cyclase (GGDEF)-like protein
MAWMTRQTQRCNIGSHAPEVHKLMTTAETTTAPAELAIARPTRDIRSVRQRAILRAAAGFMIPFIAGIPIVSHGGVISVTWTELGLVFLAVLSMWAVLLCVVTLGWDRWLRFDPHFLIVPSAAAAILMWLFIYIAPEARMGTLQGWYIVLLFGAGWLSLKSILALNAFMAGGYIGTLVVLETLGEPIAWPFEIGIVILPFVLFTYFYATVLERWRRDRVEMNALRSQLSYFALTDPLTDLPNRRQFDDHLQQHSALCSRLGITYAIGLIDVDHFKEINDSLGHDVGDRVLVELAGIISGALRQSDLAARLGGDEFAILMAKTDVTEAAIVLNRILQAVASHQFSATGLQDTQVTISIGVTECVGDEAPTEVLRRADTKLYAAKRDGRNRLAVAAP